MENLQKWAKTPRVTTQGSGAQQSCKVPALVKTLLTQGSFSHIPMWLNILLCLITVKPLQEQQETFPLRQKVDRTLSFSSNPLWQIRLKFADKVKQGLQSKAMREGVGTEVGKAQLHNLCSQRRTSRFKKQKNLVFPGYCYSQKLYANAFYLNGFFSLLSLLKMRLQLTLHTVKI